LAPYHILVPGAPGRRLATAPLAKVGLIHHFKLGFTDNQTPDTKKKFETLPRSRVWGRWCWAASARSRCRTSSWCCRNWMIPPKSNQRTQLSVKDPLGNNKTIRTIYPKGF